MLDFRPAELVVYFFNDLQKSLLGLYTEIPENYMRYDFVY